MLYHFGSISSVSYQFLVLESPFIQGLCYNLKGLELFSKTNFESSCASEGLKICTWLWILCYPFGLVFCPSPSNEEMKQISFHYLILESTETYDSYTWIYIIQLYKQYPITAICEFNWECRFKLRYKCNLSALVSVL